MINIFLVVIATQFSETKKRETERMIAERRKSLLSTSSLDKSSVTRPGSCWEEFLKMIGRSIRQSCIQISKLYRPTHSKALNNVRFI